MGTQIFPSLRGLSYPVVRSPVWSTNVLASISGKETAVALQAYPRWKWDLTINVLQTAAGIADFQQLIGFLNTLRGRFDTFLYQDADDNTVTGQAIGIGDGSTKSFPLVRALGGFVEPVLAWNSVAATRVYLNGTLQSVSNYGITLWGTSSPGVLTFTSAPASGAVITADLSYYWPCRMLQDNPSFSLFVQGMYDLKKLSFMSVK